jgi:hypothetical protein
MNTWDIYFSTVVGWSLHPGYNKEGTKKISLEEAAKIADEMMRLRGERKWLG